MPLAISVALAALLVGPSEWSAAVDGARSYRATAAGLLRIAEGAQRNGDVRTAEAAYRALLDDPSPDVRAEALYRLAMLEAHRGRQRQAAALLRHILDDKPDAAGVRLQLAQLLDRMGDKDGAWRQVRAVQAGLLPPEAARLVDRYSEALRTARPLGASFEVAIAPDSNIGRSTRSDTLGTVLGDFVIDEDSKARSGIGVAVRGQAFRRLDLGRDAGLLFRIGGSADLYGKPRFNDLALDFAAGPELHAGRNRLGVELGATQRWLGQKPYLRSVRAAASLTRPLGRRSQLRAAAAASLLDHRLNDLQDGTSLSASVGLERALSAATGLAVSLSADRLSARDPAYSTTGWRAGAFAWRDVGRATVTLGAEHGRLRADDRLALLPEARSDRLTRFTVGATLRQLGFAGFAPVARLVVERNRSTVAFHDYGRTRTELGLVRAF